VILPTIKGAMLATLEKIKAESILHHGRPFSLNLTLPPLAAVFLKRIHKYVLGIMHRGKKNKGSYV